MRFLLQTFFFAAIALVAGIGFAARLQPPVNGIQVSPKGYDISVSQSLSYLLGASIRNHPQGADESSFNSRSKLFYNYRVEKGVVGFYTFFDFGRHWTGDQLHAFHDRYDTEAFGLGAHWDHTFNGHLGFFVRGGFNLSKVAHNDYSGTYGRGDHYVVALGPSYQWDDHLALSLGVSLWTRLQRSPLWLPYVRLRWSPHSRWVIFVSQNIESIYAGTQWDLVGNKKVFLDLSFGYLYRQYSLSDQSDKTSLHDSAFKLEWGAKVRIGESFVFRPYGEALFNRRLSAYRGGAKRPDVSDRSLNTGYGFGLEGSFIF